MAVRRTLPLVLAFVALIAAVLTGAGCQQAQTLGGKPRPKTYRRIVSLSPSTTEILAGNSVNLVGRTSACDFPSNVVSLPVVGSTKPDYEALSRLKPDLIVYDAELYGDAEVRKLKTTGATLFAYDPQTLDEYFRAVYELGSIVGAETGFSGYVDRVNTEARSADGDPPTPKPRVALILPDASGRHLIGGKKGLRADCLRIAGGEQVGPDSARFEPLSPEFLVKEDPDVIIVAGDRAAFEKDPRFAGLKARRNANVYGLPQDVMLRRGQRIDKLIRGFHKALSLATETKPAAASASAAPAGTAATGTN